jgi:hypothetical protein
MQYRPTIATEVDDECIMSFSCFVLQVFCGGDENT